MQFIIRLENVFECWQCIDDVPVVVLAVLVDFHACCAATHFLLHSYGSVIIFF